MKNLWLILCGVATLVSCSSTREKLQEQQDFVEQTVIEDRDISGIPNGIYNGSADAGLVAAQVNVEVMDGEIRSVTLVEHDCLLGKPAEALVEEVVNQQSVELDAVSGATISSKVILTAVSHALQAHEELGE